MTITEDATTSAPFPAIDRAAEYAAKKDAYFKIVTEKAKVYPAGTLDVGEENRMQRFARDDGRSWRADVDLAYCVYEFQTRYSAAPLPATDPTPDDIKAKELDLRAASVVRTDAERAELIWRQDRRELARVLSTSGQWSGDTSASFQSETSEGWKKLHAASAAARQECERVRVELETMRKVPHVRKIATDFPEIAAHLGLRVAIAAPAKQTTRKH